MSGYDKMKDVGVFWKRLMAITGILCMATLILPTVLFVKYIAFDYPHEQDVAKGALAANAGRPAPSSDSVRYYIIRATSSPAPSDRSHAIAALETICRLPGSQVLHWMECLNAKITIERVAQSDKDPTVVASANTALAHLGQHGVTFKR